MTKARTLADFISDGNPLADGTIAVSEVSGAAPLASPTFTGTATVAGNLSVDGGTIKLDGNYPVGTKNVALGDTALDAVQSGAENNIAVGASALSSVTTGDDNTAVGNFSLASTTGSQNTGVGQQALRFNTSGQYNTAQGYRALFSNTTANNNTAVGYTAGYSNTTGAQNTFIGRQASYRNTTGLYNSSFGNDALYYNTTGGYNTALGAAALNNNTTASANTAVGYQALTTNTTGGDNAAFGYQAAQSNTTGDYLTAIGRQALYNNTTASNNTAVGYWAGYTNTTGSSLTVVGRKALYSNTTGNYNTALGHTALENNTTASNNTAVGYQAGLSNTTGNYNTALGHTALRNNTTASYNTAVGYQAGYAYNGALGSNTFIGFNSGKQSTGDSNTFVGARVVSSGKGCGQDMTTGAKNTILGAYSGNQGGLDIRTSSNNIVLSDGDGNPRLTINSSGVISGNGSGLTGVGGLTTLVADNVSPISSANSIIGPISLGDYHSQTFTFFLKSNGGNTGRCQMRLYNSSGSAITSDYQSSTRSGATFASEVADSRIIFWGKEPLQNNTGDYLKFDVTFTDAYSSTVATGIKWSTTLRNTLGSQLSGSGYGSAGHEIIQRNQSFYLYFENGSQWSSASKYSSWGVA